MFEDYLLDAYQFFQLAEAKKNNGEEREAKMYYRAAVFCAASSLEAFVNLIGNAMTQGNTLDKIEIAFLNDVSLEVLPSRAEIVEKLKFNSISEKIKFVIKKFNIALDIAAATQWRDFLQFKEFRNSLIHSRAIEDEITTAEYSSNIKKGLNANIDIMNVISLRLDIKANSFKRIDGINVECSCFCSARKCIYVFDAVIYTGHLCPNLPVMTTARIVRTDINKINCFALNLLFSNVLRNLFQ